MGAQFGLNPGPLGVISPWFPEEFFPRISNLGTTRGAVNQLAKIQRLKIVPPKKVFLGPKNAFKHLPKKGGF